MFNPKEEMILYNYDIFQPFDELFEVAIHAAAKFTTEYKASETADEVDGVCDSANEVCALKTKQITLICRSYWFDIHLYTCVSCIHVHDDFLLDSFSHYNFSIFYMYM